MIFFPLQNLRECVVKNSHRMTHFGAERDNYTPTKIVILNK